MVNEHAIVESTHMLKGKSFKLGSHFPDKKWFSSHMTKY